MFIQGPRSFDFLLLAPKTTAYKRTLLRNKYLITKIHMSLSRIPTRRNCIITWLSQILRYPSSHRE